MRRCQNCPLNKYRLKCLACEQKTEAEYTQVYPQIITPLKHINLPWDNLPDKQKAIYILRAIGAMSYRQLARLTKTDLKTIFRQAQKKQS